MKIKSKEEVQKECTGTVFYSHEFWKDAHMCCFTPYDGVQEIISPDIWEEPEAAYPYI